MLLTEPPRDAVRRLAPERLSPAARETLDLFRLLARTSARYGTQSLGALIVSMTHHASDVLMMIWLSRLGAACENVTHVPLPIMPLLETIDDLRRADGILREMFAQPAYRAHLEALGRNQVCMIGYSDSVKDGGYLAANWQLYDAQQHLARLAGEFKLQITFFHGRGGALGRGGGPAAQAVLSLPPASVAGRLRVTEQGEVVAERYGDLLIAHRHLEQLTWATMLVSAQMEPPPDPQWIARLSAAADEGYQAYRRLIEDAEFPAYFNRATPIEAIESLPIGSRPSRRNQRATLDQLRAIPYTFAWTQSRHLITGYLWPGERAGRIHPRRLAGLDRDVSRLVVFPGPGRQCRTGPLEGRSGHCAALCLDGLRPGHDRPHPGPDRKRAPAHATSDFADQAARRSAGDHALAEALGGLAQSAGRSLELRAGRTPAASPTTGRPAGGRQRNPGGNAAFERARHLHRRADDGLSLPNSP